MKARKKCFIRLRSDVLITKFEQIPHTATVFVTILSILLSAVKLNDSRKTIKADSPNCVNSSIDDDCLLRVNLSRTVFLFNEN